MYFSAGKGLRLDSHLQDLATLETLMAASGQLTGSCSQMCSLWSYCSKVLYPECNRIVIPTPLGHTLDLTGMCFPLRLGWGPDPDQGALRTPSRLYSGPCSSCTLDPNPDVL